jgi:hypothetical protein
LPLVPHASIVSDKETFGYFLDSKGTKLITGSRDSLVTAIRECAEIIASQNPESFGAVTEFLESQQWFIFTRVLLYLLGNSPTAPINLIVHYSTQPYLFSEVTVRHEYSLLLKRRFRVLTEEQQSVVLRMIENGPDKLSYVRAMTSASGEPQWLLRALSRLLAIMPPDEVRITAILGYRFPWLMHLSKTWAAENADGIFPRSQECRWRWEAAWCTYVAFSGAYNDVLGVLSNQYAKAVNEVSAKHIFKKSRLNPDQGLAQHLAIYYWRQLITLQHPMLVKFFLLGGEEPVRSFISHIGRGMSEVKDVPRNVVDSLRGLAEWMESGWRPRRKGAKKALAAFGWWFPHEFLGDPNWRLRTLGGAMRKAGNAENIDRVLKELDLLASEKPAQVIECLKGLVERAPKESSFYFLANNSFGILEKAVSVANSRTRAKIADIADYFGSNGHFEYRRFAQAPNE